jgi:ubiquinone/menaquinone biosynthesis C-methylase UbiE
MFDACRAERVLMYLDDPRQALAEMARITRVGGRIVVWEPDNEAVSVDHPDAQQTRRIVQVCSNAIRRAWIGRCLPALFRDFGLAEVAGLPHSVTPSYAAFRQLLGGSVEQASQAGVLSAQDVAAWRPREEAARAERFFAAMAGFIVSGRKPMGGREA